MNEGVDGRLRTQFIIPVHIMAEKVLIQRLEVLVEKGVCVVESKGQVVDVILPAYCHKKEHWEKEAKAVYAELMKGRIIKFGGEKKE